MIQFLPTALSRDGRRALLMVTPLLEVLKSWLQPHLATGMLKLHSTPTCLECEVVISHETVVITVPTTFGWHAAVHLAYLKIAQQFGFTSQLDQVVPTWVDWNPSEQKPINLPVLPMWLFENQK
jgi:hypothetical protein